MSNDKIAEQNKSAKKYAKTRNEHYKDIVIAILITGIVAFISGTHFANQQNAHTAQAVQSATAQSAAKK